MNGKQKKKTFDCDSIVIRLKLAAFEFYFLTHQSEHQIAVSNGVGLFLIFGK